MKTAVSGCDFSMNGANRENESHKSVNQASLHEARVFPLKMPASRVEGPQLLKHSTLAGKEKTHVFQLPTMRN